MVLSPVTRESSVYLDGKQLPVPTGAFPNAAAIEPTNTWRPVSFGCTLSLFMSPGCAEAVPQSRTATFGYFDATVLITVLTSCMTGLKSDAVNNNVGRGANASTIAVRSRE